MNLGSSIDTINLQAGRAVAAHLTSNQAEGFDSHSLLHHIA